MLRVQELIDSPLFHRIYGTLALAYAFVLPIYHRTSIKILMILLPLGLLIAWRDVFSRESWRRYKFPLIFAAIMTIGMMWSSDLREALKILEDKILIIPGMLVVGLACVRTVAFKKLLFAFLAGNIAAALFCIAWASYREYTEGAYWAFYHMVFTDILNAHPIYMGYYVNFCMIITAYYFLDPQKPLSILIRISGVAIILFFIVIHVFLSGRAPIAGLAIVMLVWLIRYAGSFFIYTKWILLFVVAGVMAVYLVSYRTLLVDRFKDLFVSQQQISDTDYGGYLERLMLWKAGIAANTNPIFGVGTGDVQHELNRYYKSSGFDESYITEGYNSHNQYVHIYLGNGLIGLAALLLMLGQPVTMFFKKGHFLAFFFFAPFLFYGLTEVFLGRHQGLAFYFLFYVLFVFYPDEN